MTNDERRMGNGEEAGETPALQTMTVVAPQMTVVCGAPGSGKTTWVRSQMRRGELVVDVDHLFAGLTMRPLYDKPESLIGAVLSVRDHVIENLRPAWVTSSDPSAEYRAGMRERYGARVVVVETPAETCVERIRADARRDEGTDWEGLVMGWWGSYERDERDERITDSEVAGETPAGQVDG